MVRDIGAAASDRILYESALGVAASGYDDHAVAVLGRDCEERRQGTESEVGGDGDRIDAQRAGRVEPSPCVSLAGAADISPLRIRDDEETPVARQGDEPLQRRVARCAVRLPKADLRLQDPHVAGHGVDHHLAESVEAVGVASQAPVRKERRTGVNANTKGSMLLKSICETPAEGHVADVSAGRSPVDSAAALFVPYLHPDRELALRPSRRRIGPLE